MNEASDTLNSSVCLVPNGDKSQTNKRNLSRNTQGRTLVRDYTLVGIVNWIWKDLITLDSFHSGYKKSLRQTFFDYRD